LPGAAWPHWRWLAVLLLLVACGRAWQVGHTRMTSRDSIGYTHYAWRLDHEPWLRVVRSEHHQPGYPLSIYLLAKPVKLFVPDNLPLAMQLAAQLVSCLASLLLVFPMYFLGCELFDRRVAFWASLLYQCLPAPGRVLGDGLSDPLALLFTAAALWAALVAVRTGKVRWFVAVGLASALAYLTRTEGALTALCCGVVLLGLQASRRWRRPWAWVARAGLGLSAGAVLVVPFMLLIGGVTTKPSFRYWMYPSEWKMAPATPQAAHAVAGPPLAMWYFGAGVKPEDRYGWAAWALLVELVKGFCYFFVLPATAGLYLYRRRFLDRPGAWVPLVAGGVLSLLLYRLGQSNGYIGERHVLAIVLGGVYFAVAALVLLAGGLARLLPGGRPGRAAWFSLAVLAVLTAAPAARTLGPLHGDRDSFRRAGEWLAAHARPEDGIEDPFAWASYYAGRTFQRGLPESLAVLAYRSPPPPLPAVVYVVLEESKNKHPQLYYLVGPAQKLVRDRKGELVQSFPLAHGKHGGAVHVYRVRMTPPRAARVQPAGSPLAARNSSAQR
jgi:hypothetical protein